MKRFAFVMDSLEKLDLPWDTSLCLLRELARRGHETVLVNSSSVSLVWGQVKGRGCLIQSLGDHRYRQGSKKIFDLKNFDAVFIRKDPPFDAGYLALTHLLEPLAGKTPVINHPRGIRNANEKLYGLHFPPWSPPTLVSANPDEILGFQKKIRSDLVIKPLYEKGGKGIFLLRKNSRKGLKLIEPVVAQKFIPLPKGGGDKRILLWKGKILGAFERVPRPGEFRSNLSLGASFRRCSVTGGEKRLARTLRPSLLKEGLWFVGIDVRAGLLLEVNVTSPAGLVELDQLYGAGFTEKVADDLEKM